MDVVTDTRASVDIAIVGAGPVGLYAATTPDSGD